MASLNHQAYGVLDLASAACCPDRVLLSKHSNQNEKPDLGQESDAHDRDHKEHVARRERVHECIASCEASGVNHSGWKMFRFQMQTARHASGAKDKEHAMSQIPNTAIAVIGIDIGKNSFHVVGHDARGAIVLRQTWSRGQVEARLANLPPCLIGMEACVGAHHLSRKLQMLGHDARLMPAKYVRPYSKGQKNDFRDAEAIAEAVQRPTMKFVATKTADQLDLQALHRVRDRLVGQRTGVINQIRAFLLERGIAVRQGLRSLRCELPGIRSFDSAI